MISSRTSSPWENHSTVITTKSKTLLGTIQAIFLCQCQKIKRQGFWLSIMKLKNIMRFQGHKSTDMISTLFVFSKPKTKPSISSHAEQTRKWSECSSPQHVLPIISTLLPTKTFIYSSTHSKKKKNICWKDNLKTLPCCTRPILRVALKSLGSWQKCKGLKDRKSSTTTMRKTKKPKTPRNKKSTWRKPKRSTSAFHPMMITLSNTLYGPKWTSCMAIPMNCSTSVKAMTANWWQAAAKV